MTDYTAMLATISTTRTRMTVPASPDALEAQDFEPTPREPSLQGYLDMLDAITYGRQRAELADVYLCDTVRP